MKSLGRRPEGARLERIQASPLWDGERFRNRHPVIPGLRDPKASMPALHEFLCGGARCVPRGPLPSVNPLAAWAKPPDSGLRATWLGHSTVLIEIGGRRRIPGAMILELSEVDQKLSLIPHDREIILYCT